MASLSHASFATPNTQQTPLPKLLPSHLSMDPTSSSSLSTLSQHHSSSAELSWLQKPSSKLSYHHLHPMSSFNHQFGLSPPLYEGYSDAGDSIQQGFIGGDDPLLTSSWEALDKLVSASMTNSGSAHERSDFAPASMRVQSTSPSPISEVEQKPLNGFYSSNNQKGGVCSMWDNDQARQHANGANTSNVGLSLANLISADPGFVERAAKFSSYSQQINQAYSTLNQNNNNINSFNNVLSSDNVKFSHYINNSSSYKCPLFPKGDNVAAMELDAKSDLTVLHKPSNDTTKMSENKWSKSPQAGSMVTTNGSKKKREGQMKEGKVDDEEANHDVGRKRAKGGQRIDEEESSNGNNNSEVGKVMTSERTMMQQSGGSNSGEWLEQKSGGGAKEISTKPCNNVSSQAPKPDFIHVRARRGQATDSHSLAERVRREKISERMKYLQDLVPGCTKVTGKAMMLDEIINYVQSLQRQVEFLSMKLAAVHPSKLEFNFESLFGKEVVQQPILQNNHSVPFAPETHHTNNLNSYPFLHENLHLQPSPAFPESNPSSSMHSFGSDAALRRTVSMLAAASSDTFGECISQITDSWDDDLQNIVHLAGFTQSQNTHPSLQGALLQGQMKAEL